VILDVWSATLLDCHREGSRSNTQRIGTTGMPLWRHTAVLVASSTRRSPSPYQ
jgi:hypothetical protein